MEGGGQRRILRQRLEEAPGVGGVEAGLTRPYAVEEVPPRPPVQRMSAEERQGPERIGSIRPERLRERREGEPAWLDLLQDSRARHRPQEAMEAVGLAPGLRRQRLGRLSTGGEAIGDAESRHHVETLRVPVSAQEPEHLVGGASRHGGTLARRAQAALRRAL